MKRGPSGRATRLAGVLVVCAAAGARAQAPPCPETFARASGPCDERASPPGRSCVYPEGKCACARSFPCSGVPQPPGPPAWRCAAARTDGCPNDAPAQGSACKAPGKACSYGSCGGMTYTCAADQRTWFVSAVVAPPPGAAGGGMRSSTAAQPAEPTTTTLQTPATGVKTPPPWKACPSGRRFSCAPRSQGAAPPHGEEVPRVCGCIPTCPPSRRVLISFEAGGTWPDGSRKGRFSCASQGMP